MSRRKRKPDCWYVLPYAYGSLFYVAFKRGKFTMNARKRVRGERRVESVLGPSNWQIVGGRLDELR